LSQPFVRGVALMPDPERASASAERQLWRSAGRPLFRVAVVRVRTFEVCEDNVSVEAMVV
jgi:hypothetical protein